MAAVGDAFKTHEVVPDVVDTAPQNGLEVRLKCKQAFIVAILTCITGNSFIIRN